MSETDNSGGDFKLGGLKLGKNSDKKVTVIAGIVGIAVTLLLLYEKSKNSSASTVTTAATGSGQTGSTTSPIGTSATGSGSTSGASSSTLTALIASINGLESDIATANATPAANPLSFSISTNNSTATAATDNNANSGSSSNSGGGSISIVGLGSVGGSGSGSSTTTTLSGNSVDQQIANTTTESFSLGNASQGDIQSIEGLLQTLVGSSSDRANQSTIASQQAYTYQTHQITPEYQSGVPTYGPGATVVTNPQQGPLKV